MVFAGGPMLIHGPVVHSCRAFRSDRVVVRDGAHVCLILADRRKAVDCTAHFLETDRISSQEKQTPVSSDVLGIRIKWINTFK